MVHLQDVSTFGGKFWSFPPRVVFASSLDGMFESPGFCWVSWVSSRGFSVAKFHELKFEAEGVRLERGWTLELAKPIAMNKNLRCLGDLLGIILPSYVGIQL